MQETVLKIRRQYPSLPVYPCTLYLLLVCGGAGGPSTWTQIYPSTLYLLLVCGGAGPSTWTQTYPCMLYLLLICGGAGGGQGPLHGPKYIPARFTYSWFVVGQEGGRALCMDPNISLHALLTLGLWWGRRGQGPIGPNISQHALITLDLWWGRRGSGPSTCIKIYHCTLYLLLVCGAGGGAGPSTWTQIYSCMLYLLLVCGGGGGGGVFGP
jgi:hypothetical protein